MDNIDILVDILKDLKVDVQEVRKNILDLSKDVQSIKSNMVNKEECEKKRVIIEESRHINLSTKQIVALSGLATAVLSGILAIVKVFVLK